MNDGWVKTDRGWRKAYGARSEIAPAASAFPAPRVASDTMPLTEHIDGRFYDSKSVFRRVTKENGCIEVGNDPARLRGPEKPKADPAKRHAAIKKAIAQAGL